MVKSLLKWLLATGGIGRGLVSSTTNKFFANAQAVLSQSNQVFVRHSIVAVCVDGIMLTETYAQSETLLCHVFVRLALDRIADGILAARSCSIVVNDDDVASCLRTWHY